MRALAGEPVLRRRAAIGRLALTGMRVDELCGLGPDTVTLIGDAPWLRIPLGKVHNDCYVPLHRRPGRRLGSARPTRACRSARR